MTENLVDAAIVIVVAVLLTMLGTRYVASFGAVPEQTGGDDAVGASGRPSAAERRLAPDRPGAADATDAAEPLPAEAIDAQAPPEAAVATVSPGVAGDAGQDAPAPSGALDRWLSVYAPWVVAAAVVVLAIAWASGGLPLSFQVRAAVMMTVLVPVAILDVRFGVVSTRMLVVLVLGRGLSLVIETFEDGVSWSSLGQEAAVAAVVGIAFWLVRMTSRAGLGGGDVILFMLFPLLLGARLAIAAVFVSFAVAFVYSAWVLATRRATRKDSFPLCPAVLVGTVSTVLVVSLTGA